ncbi:MAG TPA: EamA family transporter [Coriobacteriia bacterium]
MLTILLSSVTSLLFGCSDFLGGLASRRDSAFAVTANAHLIGLAIMAVAVVVFPSPFGVADLAWGAAAGVAGGIGVTALYGALAVGRMGVVAPLTAALSGSLPALYDLLRGTALRPLSLVGLAIALVAIVIVSASGDPEERAEMPSRAIALAVLAGVGFTGCFIFFSLAAKTSGLMPLLAARVVSVALLMAVTFARRGHVTLAPDARASAYGAGALDAAANVTMLTAIRVGPLAVASVLGSLYPVVTILLARVVLKERLRPVQRAGVALALAAVMLTAIR